MDFSSINWLAVVLCLVVSMVIGGVWFSPKVFFKQWWKAVGKTDEDMQNMQKASSASMMATWGGTMLASVVQAIFMGFMTNTMGATDWSSGAMAGFWLWLGFLAPASLTNKLFADRAPAWFYEAGNHLVTFLVMGAIQGAM
jgi:sterol desaturase/sphingolipid hydroxylase (fatty acid hydroxylase superfamily)